MATAEDKGSGQAGESKQVENGDENKRSLTVKRLNCILIITIATIVAEISSLLFNNSSGLHKWGLVLILVEIIVLIFFAVKYVTVIKYDPTKDFSKNPLAVWSQIAATALIGIAGIVFTVSNSFNESGRQQNEMATQLMSNREKSETDFRQNIFKPLIDQIFNPSVPLETKFYQFELFQNNFNDLFNSRSIYDVLWSEAQNKMNCVSCIRDSIESAREIMKKLIALARFTNDQQELLISGTNMHADLMVGETFDTTITDDEDDGGETVKIKLLRIDGDRQLLNWKDLKKDIKITLCIECNNEHTRKRDIMPINNGDSLNVSYFNSPLSDNFLMPDGDRIAVILKEIHEHNVLLDIIHFPADYVTVGYRPSIRRVNDLINKKE